MIGIAASFRVGAPARRSTSLVMPRRNFSAHFKINCSLDALNRSLLYRMGADKEIVVTGSRVSGDDYSKIPAIVLQQRAGVKQLCFQQRIRASLNLRRHI
jgi:hypothetical protein